jgi:hypothetical protein
VPRELRGEQVGTSWVTLRVQATQRGSWAPVRR